MSTPYLFDEFFTSGLDETVSPFLKKKSRQIGKNLPIKTALTSAFFLLAAFVFHFIKVEATPLFLIPVFFLSGTPALLNAIEDIKSFEINIDILMTLAAFLSVAIGSGLEGGLLLVLFDFSGAMESMVTAKAKGALTHLNHLSPTIATLIDDTGGLHEISVREVPLGAKMRIRAGEVIPLDGRVIEGASFVNMVHLTGESVPISKEKGDEVQAGSLNTDGTLTVEVMRTSQDSTIQRIVHLINQAQEMKPKVQRFLDKFGRIYSVSIIGLSALFALILPWILNVGYLGDEGSIYRALAFLIAASPCALIIATPTAYLSAISACARSGILLKGGVTLDALANCKTLAFDKTGTLTTGELTLSQIEGGNSDKALVYAASLEQHANHPIAHAILAKNKAPLLPVTDFKLIPGKGLTGLIEGQKVSIGNAAFIAPFLQKNHQAGQMVAFLDIEGVITTFHFEDELREGITPLIDSLKETFKVVMLTGDHAENALHLQKQLHLDEVHYNLKPEDKMDIVSELSKTQGLAMVGDGINDAPALARSSVGISMGKVGSATAIDASDIVFLSDEIHHLHFLVKKARKTLRLVRENLTLALCVICFATTPALLGYIPLWVAVILHEGGTVLVGLNSLRLLKKA